MLQYFPLCLRLLGHLDFVIVVWNFDVIVAYASEKALDPFMLAEVGHLFQKFVIDSFCSCKLHHSRSLPQIHLRMLLRPRRMARDLWKLLGKLALFLESVDCKGVLIAHQTLHLKIFVWR